MSANQQASPTSGDFSSININNATITASGSGPIRILGRGGNLGGSNFGVRLQNGTVISSTASGPDAASITIIGTGGTGPDPNNAGVQILDSGTQITSVEGDILIQGVGSGPSSRGVELGSSAAVTSTGTGENAATITINGTGGTGSSFNYGVLISFGSSITSVDGAIRITGFGGAGEGTNNYGVSIAPEVLVASTGMGTHAGTITINGTGGAALTNNTGVLISGARVTSTDGAIRITGQGGNSSGSLNTGVTLRNGAVVESTGTGENAATITINGTGGAGISNNFGVFVHIDFSISIQQPRITSVHGDIEISGQGGNGSGAGNEGVNLSHTVISSIGAGINAAGIKVNGTGGAGTNSNRGVSISSETEITSADGRIEIIGHGGAVATGTNNHGINIQGGLISSFGTMTDAGPIILEGTGGGGTDASFGILIANTQITTINGDLQVTGQGRGETTALNNGGVVISSDTSILSTGSGADAGALTINGTGGAETQFNFGVRISGFRIQISSVDGDIRINGQGGVSSTADGNTGVQLSNGVISSTGTGIEAATITINGAGGAGTNNNRGVNVSASVTSIVGNIQIIGQGGLAATGAFNLGVSLNGSAALVSSLGSGVNSASITIEGTGGTGTNGNFGVQIGSAGGRVTSVEGDIRITGRGGLGTGFANRGVVITSISAPALVSSTGTGAQAANILIEGTGGGTGASSNGNAGVNIASLSANVSVVDGDLQITGTAGVGTSTALELLNQDDIFVTGTGSATLIADSMNIGGTNAAIIHAGTNTVTLRPKTNGTAIDLGGVDAPGILGLTDTELDNIVAGRLIIGDSTSGNMTISDAISRAAATDMELYSGGSIVFDPGSLDTGGGDLLLAPGAGSVQPNTSGTDVVGETVSFASALRIAIEGTTVDAEYNQFNVNGTVNLNGTTLVLAGDFVPAVGDVFTIVSATSVTGQFNGLEDGAVFLFNDAALRINFTATSVTLTTVPINSPPTIHAPETQTAYEDIGLALTGITVDDPDGDNLTVTLSVEYGTLTLGSTTGLTVSNNGTASVSLFGSLTNLNAALASLVYRGNLNFASTDTVNIMANDEEFSTSSSVTILVKSALDQAAYLNELVNGLLIGGILNKGQATALMLQLKGTEGDIDKVLAFLNKTQTFIEEGVLSEEQAAPLLSFGNILLQSVTIR